MPFRESAPLMAVAAGVVVAASVRVHQARTNPQLPLAGFLAAVVLVLQAVNFPVFGAASAHLMGTTLVVFVAGPALGALALASVLTIQALFLQDGGLLAIGANYLNIVVFPALVAVLGLGLLPAGASARRWGWTAGFAAAAGTSVGAFACAVQLALAGIIPMRRAIVWLVGCYSLVGIVEGVLTGVAVASLVRRGVVGVSRGSISTPARAGGWLVPVLVVAALLAVLLPFASQRPDVLQSLLRREH